MRVLKHNACLSKYVDNSIKHSERKYGGAVDSVYGISGPPNTKFN